MSRSILQKLAVSIAMTYLLTSCGGDASTDASDGDRPTVVVTTNILGDVVQNLVGDTFDVVTIMPVGTDPHDFQASAQQVAEIGEADVMIVNGASFEEGLRDVIESAEADGVPVYEAISAVETIEFGDHEEHDDDEDHDDDEHDDDEHDDDEHDEHDEHEHNEHGHEGGDPHFFTDPARMAVAADGIITFLVDTVEGIDGDALTADAAVYIAELEALDVEVEDQLSTIPEDQRVLITNHEVFGYFADRYGFEVAGTVIPSGTTSDGADAEALAELAELIEHEGVPAIFADTSSSTELASVLADEVGSVEVVQLYTESLGDADSDGATYVGMIRANAELITGALAR